MTRDEPCPHPGGMHLWREDQAMMSLVCICGATWPAEEIFNFYTPEHAQAPAATAPQGWQPIDSAPKGGGAADTRDPKWVEPPRILVFAGELHVAYWDWYYAEGGNGYTDGAAWVGEEGPLRPQPTHWMAIPDPPSAAPSAAVPRLTQEPKA